MPVRYVITTLKPGVRPEDYERWLREYDYRVAKTLPSIVSYRTHRIEGPITGAERAGWHYIERIEVRDKEQYAGAQNVKYSQAAGPPSLIHEGEKVNEAALKALIRAAVALNLQGNTRPKAQRASSKRAH